MSIEACCHWSEAEDVCVVVEGKDFDNVMAIVNDRGYDMPGFKPSYQIPMTRLQACVLAEQLFKAAARCDFLEEQLDIINQEQENE